MILSELLREYPVCTTYKMENEQEFETLGLVAAEVEKTKCTFLDRLEFMEDITDDFTMIITNKEIGEKIKDRKQGICIVENPRIVFFRLHNALIEDGRYITQKDATTIGKNCQIHPTAIIPSKGVTIGDNTVIEEYVVIRENTTIGSNCLIRAGVKIGGSDFEFKRDGDEVFSVEHLGGVIIGDHVEIQYNTGINKALYPWDNTILEDYVKVDMLVHIAHGVKIGHGTMVVANTGIGGRTTIGKNCWIGFAATLRNGIHIGDDARVNMGAVVTRDVKDGQDVTGNFAIDHDKFMENLKKIR